LHSAFDRLISDFTPSPAGSRGATQPSSPTSSPKSAVRPAKAASPTPKDGVGRNGVIKLGSTAAEVIRLLGPPDRTEPGPLPGSVFMVYGQLRLELRHGVVVGGGTGL
jgi:hypothetical protein